ncbi:MAG: 3-deoxy-manno-octulosonate cytidylyltransferase [Sphingomonas bacterium]|nr:3-deoxy-manno-octulosonate cytidylyltransferase [Sphingomonas bacterium]
MLDPHLLDHDKPCIIIPARFGSSRYPGKPLARLTGAGGVERSLIEWTWRAARKVPGVGTFVVATDDRRIAQEVERFGGVAVMTPTGCANGTERCAAALDAFDRVPDIVVNFQGDAPLTPPSIVAALIDRMQREAALAVATPAIACRDETYRHLIADRAAGRVGGTTVVFNRHNQALYFSKNVIPFVSLPSEGGAHPIHLHLGVYAYRASTLAAYVAAPPSALEIAEGLEQLRFLDMGVGVGTVVCEPPDGAMIELNNPTDAVLIENELRRLNL